MNLDPTGLEFGTNAQRGYDSGGEPSPGYNGKQAAGFSESRALQALSDSYSISAYQASKLGVVLGDFVKDVYRNSILKAIDDTIQMAKDFTDDPLGVLHALGPTIVGLTGADITFGMPQVAPGEMLTTKVTTGLAFTTMETKIVFGTNPNAIFHAARHVVDAGLDVKAAQEAISADVSAIADSLQIGDLHIGTISFNGTTLSYSAFRVDGTTINVGRITPTR